MDHHLVVGASIFGLTEFPSMQGDLGQHRILDIAATPITIKSLGRARFRDKDDDFLATGSHFEVFFLRYQPGAITAVASQGRNVISGLFSGCLMASYHLNGSAMVGHVFKDAKEPEQDCSELWRKMQAGAYPELKAVDAHDFNPHALIGAEANGELRLAVVTAAGRRYAIGCDRKEIKLPVDNRTDLQKRQSERIQEGFFNNLDADNKRKVMENITAKGHWVPRLKIRKVVRIS